jgi:TetR/AcrR family transcriptional regulator
MPKIIDHKKRKQDILKRAFVIFAQKGYQDTNLSYIADRCGISRPTLYLYFKDKEEIFYFAVKEMTSSMFKQYRNLFEDDSMTQLEKLKFICSDIIRISYRQKDFYYCLADFLFQMKRQGLDYSREIQKRTVGLTFLLSRILRKGVLSGEFRSMEPKSIASQLFNMLQAFAFQIALIDTFKPEPAIEATCSFLDSLKA